MMYEATLKVKFCATDDEQAKRRVAFEAIGKMMPMDILITDENGNIVISIMGGEKND